MTTDAPFAPRILMLVTRNIDEPISRANTLRGIQSALQVSGIVTARRVPALTESINPFGVFYALRMFFYYLLVGCPLPLQCIFFLHRDATRALLRDIHSGAFDVIYVDSVRLFHFAHSLRRLRAKVDMIVDFDDLLSRRASYLRSLGKGFGGAGARQMPRFLRMLLSWPPATRAITSYERRTLLRAERVCAQLADHIVLVSAYERDLFASTVPTARARIHCIPPAIALHPDTPPPSTTGRFVFVGPDTQVHNALAIQFLLNLWSVSKPRLPLYIYGRQNIRWPSIPGVHFCGFVNDTADIFTPATIVLAPFHYPGGVKTKILEAWAHNCPVLTNAIGVEGMHFSSYPLCIDLEHWDAYVTHPEHYQTFVQEAAALGHQYVVNSSSAVSERWASLLRFRRFAEDSAETQGDGY